MRARAGEARRIRMKGISAEVCVCSPFTQAGAVSEQVQNCHAKRAVRVLRYLHEGMVRYSDKAVEFASTVFCNFFYILKKE